MIKTGLLSITFRNLSSDSIVELARAAGLDGIEWGGDVHLPPGDPSLARQLGDATRAAGLSVSAYGSYYRAGGDDPAAPAFETVLETAAALQAPVIRVWAGRRGSDEAGPDYRAKVTDELRRVAGMAESANIKVACEWHARTLTDTNASALRLLREVDHSNFLTFWQPHNKAGFEEHLAGLRAVLPWLCNLHVFCWRPADGRMERRPLAEGAGQWRAFLEAVAATGREHYASLEFVAADDPEAFRRDAATLKGWLGG